MMLFGKPKNTGGYFFAFLFLITVAYIFAQGLGILMIYLKEGSLQSVTNTFEFAKNYPVYFKILQITQSITLFFLPAYFFPYFVGNKPSVFFQKSKIKVSVIISVFLLIIILMPFINFTARLNGLIPLPDTLYEALKQNEQQVQNLINFLLSTKEPGSFCLNLTVFAIIPAISEELFFRGVLQRLFIDWLKNIHVAILITAFIFSFVHFQFLTFIPRFILGIILGYLYVWSRNIWVSVTAHFFNNSMAVVIHSFFSGQTQQRLENFGTNTDLISIIFNIFVIFIILYALKKYFDNEQKQSIR